MTSFTLHYTLDKYNTTEEKEAASIITITFFHKYNRDEVYVIRYDYDIRVFTNRKNLLLEINTWPKLPTITAANRIVLASSGIYLPNVV